MCPPVGPCDCVYMGQITMISTLITLVFLILLCMTLMILISRKFTVVSRSGLANVLVWVWYLHYLNIQNRVLSPTLTLVYSLPNLRGSLMLMEICSNAYMYAPNILKSLLVGPLLYDTGLRVWSKVLHCAHSFTVSTRRYNSFLSCTLSNCLHNMTQSPQGDTSSLSCTL